MAKFKRNNLQLKTNQKIQLGNNQQSAVQYDGTDLKLTNDGGQLTLDANGIALNSGVSINQFSNDPALGYGINVLPTQYAVKTYVDAKIQLGIENGNQKLLTGDTTAEVVFVQQQGSLYYSIGYSIINTVDNPSLLFVSGVFEKSVDGFKVMFSSPMDTDNYELSWIVTDMLLGSSSLSSSSSSLSSSSSSSSTSTALPSNLTFLIHASDYDDPEGVLLEVPGSQETFADQGLSYIYRSTMQADGRVVLPCYDGNGPVIAKCYEAGSLTTESWSTSIVGSSLYYFVDVAILNNGNLVFSWVDYDDDVPYFAILSPEGAILTSMTDARAGTQLLDADSGYNVYVIPLEDGGFLLTWKYYSYTEICASLWEANGTNRESAQDFYTGDYEAVNAETAQMLTDASPSYLSGQFPVFDTVYGYGWWYNVTDLGEEWDYEGTDYYGDSSISRVLPMWATDSKIAVVIQSGSSIVGTIVDDIGNFDFERKAMLSGYVLNSVNVLSDNTFLIQATSVSDYGLNYWIFDENLDYVSGPTAAFTGLTANNLPNVKGGAI